MKINLKVSSMYWMYNILLLMYWAALIPMLIYRLFKEEGFYQRIKQSIGYLPDDLKENIGSPCYLGPCRISWRDCGRKSDCPGNA